MKHGISRFLKSNAMFAIKTITNSKNLNMKLNKSLVLPILGMVVLVSFNLWSYQHDAIFLDRLLVCTLILGLVCISKILENAQQSINPSKSNEDGNWHGELNQGLLNGSRESEAIGSYRSDIQKKEEVA